MTEPGPEQTVEERVAQLEAALDRVTENQAAVRDYIGRRLFMIDELTNDIRRVLGLNG